MDAVPDSGLMFYPGWNTPGVRKADNGIMIKPAGWSPSVRDIFGLAKKYQTISRTRDAISDGGATCEGFARLVKEHSERKPQTPGNEGGQVTRIAVAVWCCNDTATLSPAKGGKLLKAAPHRQTR